MKYQDNGWEYNRNGTNPGLILIFNFINKSDGSAKRVGTNRDVNEIILCLQRQGYNIERSNIINDGTTTQIEEKLDEGICKIIYFCLKKLFTR